MIATKIVAELQGSSGTYYGEAATGGVYYTRNPEQARPIALGETVPSGFRLVRVSYEIRKAG